MLKRLDVWRDRTGAPVFILWSTKRVCNLEGLPVAFVSSEHDLFAYDGRHLATYTHGLVRDHEGKVILFGETVHDTDCPELPPRIALDAFSPPVVDPKIMYEQYRRPRADTQPVWSDLTARDYIQAWNPQAERAPYVEFSNLGELRKYEETEEK